MLVAALLLPLSLALAAGAPEPQAAEPARLAGRALALDLARHGERVIAVGDRGHVLLSEDGGESFRQVIAPVRSLLTAVALVDDRHAWAVGHDGVVLASEDGGHSWELRRWEPEEETPLLDLWFGDVRHGIAVGAYGLTLETRDGGATWEERRLSDEDPHLNAIVAAGGERLFVVGEFGALLTSADSGESFDTLDSPYTGSFFGVLPLEDDGLLVHGLRGKLFRSEDAGASFLPVSTGTTASIFDIERLGDGRLVATGTDGLWLVSEDGGRSFRAVRRADRRGVAALVELGSGALLTAGEAGLMRIADPADPAGAVPVEAAP